MIRLSRWCFEHRRKVVAGWLLALVVVLSLSQGLGSKFSSDFSLPGTDSQAAVTLLTQNFPAATGEGDDVVIQSTHGATVRSASVRAAVTAALAKVARVPGVQSVGSPYGAQGGAQISRDGTIAFATVTWDKVPDDMTNTDASNLTAAADSADRADLRISLAGEVISDSEGAGPGLSVVVGVIAALIILLVVFGGALLAALLPLLTAVVMTRGWGVVQPADNRRVAELPAPQGHQGPRPLPRRRRRRQAALARHCQHRGQKGPRARDPPPRDRQALRPASPHVRGPARHGLARSPQRARHRLPGKVTIAAGKHR